MTLSEFLLYIGKTLGPAFDVKIGQRWWDSWKADTRIDRDNLGEGGSLRLYVPDLDFTADGAKAPCMTVKKRKIDRDKAVAIEVTRTQTDFVRESMSQAAFCPMETQALRTKPMVEALVDEASKAKSLPEVEVVVGMVRYQKQLLTQLAQALKSATADCKNVRTKRKKDEERKGKADKDSHWRFSRERDFEALVSLSTFIH